jgi:hypothetical protein
MKELKTKKHFEKRFIRLWADDLEENSWCICRFVNQEGLIPPTID